MTPAMLPDAPRKMLGRYHCWPPAALWFDSVRPAAVRPLAERPAAHYATGSFANSGFPPATAGGSPTLARLLCRRPIPSTPELEQSQCFDTWPGEAKTQ